MISILTLALVVSLLIYGGLFDRPSTSALAQISISNVSLKYGNEGNYSLSIIVKNIGTQVVSLTGYLYASLAPSFEFSPEIISPGETSVGLASISWRVASFDGASGFMKVADSASLNPKTLTIEASFKYNDYNPDQQMLLDKGPAGGDAFYFYTFRSVNNINDFVVYNNGTRYDQQLGNIFTPGTWFTVDFTIDGKSVNAYVNGVLVDSWARSILFRGNMNDILLGSCSCGGYFFNGSIAFLRMYSRALSGAEIQQNYLATTPVSESLALWLSFNQTSGVTVKDLAGNGNSATIRGGVSFGQPLAPCDWYSYHVSARANDGARYSLSQNARLTC